MPYPSALQARNSITQLLRAYHALKFKINMKTLDLYDTFPYNSYSK